MKRIKEPFITLLFEIGGNANVPCVGFSNMVSFPKRCQKVVSGTLNMPASHLTVDYCFRQLQKYVVP